MRTPNDDRSDTMNPNNPRYRADRENRARQGSSHGDSGSSEDSASKEPRPPQKRSEIWERDPSLAPRLEWLDRYYVTPEAMNRTAKEAASWSLKKIGEVFDEVSRELARVGRPGTLTRKPAVGELVLEIPRLVWERDKETPPQREQARLKQEERTPPLAGDTVYATRIVGSHRLTAKLEGTWIELSDGTETVRYQFHLDSRKWSAITKHNPQRWVAIGHSWNKGRERRPWTHMSSMIRGVLKKQAARLEETLPYDDQGSRKKAWDTQYNR